MGDRYVECEACGQVASTVNGIWSGSAFVCGGCTAGAYQPLTIDRWVMDEQDKLVDVKFCDSTKPID